ncbi:MAG: alginate lyase family protein [Phycisphaerae bacterium]|nr:alginate lyase family protein [Phycisphaerae bacterium]
MDRRGFLKAVGAVSIGPAALDQVCAWAALSGGQTQGLDLRVHERGRVLRFADPVLDAVPGSVTEDRCARSAGGAHDFYSEGDYWWPDPNNPDGPYVQRDGLSNPDNFSAHRHAMVRLSRITAALTAAYRITGEAGYARAAVRHLRVWFLDDGTRMNPHLLYAQAIQGRCTGRGIGIIDTIHLAEVAQSILVLEEAKAIPAEDLRGLKAWFSDYLNWIQTHPYGQDERKAQNNHGTCWVMQASAFARLVGNDQVLGQCRDLFVNKLLPEQVEADGSFPRELARTKHYCYSLFNLDVMGIAAHILSTPDRNLWTAENAKGGGLKRAMAYHYPFIADKSKWPFKPDVLYFDLFPVRMPALLFGAMALKEPRYIDLWKRLDSDPTHDEVIRNFPVRQPVLWITDL